MGVIHSFLTPSAIWGGGGGAAQRALTQTGVVAEPAGVEAVGGWECSPGKLT